MLIAATTTVLAAGRPSTRVDASFLATQHAWMDALPPNIKALGATIHLQDFGPHRKGFGPPVANVDTIVNFQGSFDAVGVDSNGNPATAWPYDMVGNPPTWGGTTEIDAPITPVSIRMLDANGKQAYDPDGSKLYMDATQYVQKVLHSPLFSKAWFTSSSEPTQFTDAQFRAEFWTVMRQSWHTELRPQVEAPQVMSLPYGSYEYALNQDGTCCLYVLVDENAFLGALFPPTYPVDNTTIIGHAELAGYMTTRSLSTFLFPNTFLYQIDQSGNFDCCVLGFHEFDSEPGTRANGNRPRAYVMAFASWISPGIFGGGLQDVTGLSHELAETFNDPLVLAYSSSGGACGGAGQPQCLNTTPWWLAPTGLCQNNLEVGDVIENMPNGVYSMQVHGVTYHPQNLALLPWFGGANTSLDGAYSYPDESVLTAPNTSQQLGCAGPLQ